MATTVDYILKVKSSGAVAGINATNKAAGGLNSSLLATAGSVASLVTAFGTLVNMASGLINVIVNTTKAVADLAISYIARTRRQADLAANVSKESGVHELAVRLELRSL